MAWTYTGRDDEVPRDHVRSLIGDTEESDQLLQDGQIQVSLNEAGGDAWDASWRCCEMIAAKFGRQSDIAVGDLRTALSQRAQTYMALASRLKHRSETYGVREGQVYSGGESVSEKIADYEDTDLPKPRFTKGQFDESGYEDDSYTGYLGGPYGF